MGDGEVTRLLDEWAAGDSGARERLVPLVYGELRRLAGGFLRRERPGHTLQPTALVNEALLRLFRQRGLPARRREQLMALVAQMMRRVLVDHARRHRAEKRGGDFARVTLNEGLPGVPDPGLAILDLDYTLQQLAAMDPRQAQIVELRVFGGFDVKEVAGIVGVSAATVKREWTIAKAWLHRELSR